MAETDSATVRARPVNSGGVSLPVLDRPDDGQDSAILAKGVPNRMNLLVRRGEENGSLDLVDRVGAER